MVGTFKIITMATSIEEKIIDIENDHFYDSGSVNVDGSVLKCWKAGGHGDQTFLQVLQNSCNPGFVKLGQMLGKEKLFDYIKKFPYRFMDNIDVRKYIIGNFKDSNIEELKSSIADSVTSGDDDPLIGLGVLFEILWKNSSLEEQEIILNNIKKGM